MRYLILMSLISFTAFAKTVTVLMQGKKFIPDTITISSGDSVVWVNKDPVFHTITAMPKDGKILFNSGMLGKGQKFSFTFKDVGNVKYKCLPHTEMRGEVIVK